MTHEKRVWQDEKGENKFQGVKSNDRDMKLGEFHSLASYNNSTSFLSFFLSTSIFSSISLKAADTFIIEYLLAAGY